MKTRWLLQLSRNGLMILRFARATRNFIYPYRSYISGSGSVRRSQLKKLTNVCWPYAGTMKDYPQLIVLGTGGANLGRSVILKDAYGRYLFNCGEYMQCLSEICNKRFQLEDVFLTSNTWNNVGGLPGVLMSANLDRTCTLHGPVNVDKVLKNVAQFDEKRNQYSRDAFFKIKYRSVEDGGYEIDESCLEYVDYVPLYDTSEEASVDKGGTGHFVMAYIIRFKKPPPKVVISKIKDLKLKTGPWISKVLKGETVTVDGKEITMSDIASPKEGIEPILILECPSAGYLDSLLAAEKLQGLQPQMIVHMSPVEVVNQSRYQEFINRFNCQHLMLNESCGYNGIEERILYPTLAHRIHPQIFPLTYVHNKPRPTEATHTVDTERKIVKGAYGLTYSPEVKTYDWSKVFDSDADVLYKSVEERLELRIREYEKQKRFHTYTNEGEMEPENDYSIEKMNTALQQVQDDLRHTYNADVSEEYPELVFLGTGSAQPSLRRNSSFILVQMRRDEYLIMDCGEGSLEQLLTMYGPDKTGHILSHLKAVFISHLHFDHHGGLFQLLDYRKRFLPERKEDQERLLLLVPYQINTWLNVFVEFYNDITEHVQVLYHEQWDEESMQITADLTGIAELTPVKVNHKAWPYGVVMKHEDGWSLVYSGDTTPCKALIEKGKGCDILIHEGTFSKFEQKEAEMKYHSTMPDAILVGKEMGAKHTILTHFSQRYANIPHFTDDFTENVGYTFDFMHIRPSQIGLMHKMKEVFLAAFGAKLGAYFYRRRLDQREEQSTDDRPDLATQLDQTQGTSRPSEQDWDKMKPNAYGNKQKKNNGGNTKSVKRKNKGNRDNGDTQENSGRLTEKKCRTEDSENKESVTNTDKCDASIGVLT